MASGLHAWNFISFGVQMAHHLILMLDGSF